MKKNIYPELHAKLDSKLHILQSLEKSQLVKIQIFGQSIRKMKFIVGIISVLIIVVVEVNNIVINKKICTG